MIVRSAWPLESVRAPGGTIVHEKLELEKGIADLSYELEADSNATSFSTISLCPVCPADWKSFRTGKPVRKRAPF